MAGNIWEQIKLLVGLAATNDDDPLLPLNNNNLKRRYNESTVEDEEDEEEEDEEEEDVEYEELWNTVEDFVEDVRQRVNKNNSYYFEMCSTEEMDFDSKKFVTVWWLPRTHPYAQMISRTNYNRDRVCFPCFAKYMGIIAYKDYIIEKAVQDTRELLEKYAKEEQKEEEEQEEQDPNDNNDT